ILAEQWARRARAYTVHRDTRVAPAREPLLGWPAFFAVLFSATVLLLGFGIPFGQLAVLALRTLRPEALALTASAGATTLMLGVLGALITASIGFAAAKLSAPRANRI